jgi:hypothetical protein
MDGQQRITAIQNFYDNKLKLTGLKLWEELNGQTYRELPSNIQAGIDRRSISYIAIITESTSDPEEALLLKQETFERLNTGGESLSPQEVRNCLYTGKFNSLLLELARNPIFTRAWNIPADDSSELSENTLYKKMEDAELVLRFFALRNVDNFSRGMEGFLDLYMIKSINFSDEDISFLKDVFVRTIQLADRIYAENLFKPFDPQSETWAKKAYKAYYDATMVGLSKHLDKADVLLTQKPQLIEETKKLFQTEKSNLLTGGGKGKTEIQARIELFDEMLSQVLKDV